MTLRGGLRSRRCDGIASVSFITLSRRAADCLTHVDTAGCRTCATERHSTPQADKPRPKQVLMVPLSDALIAAGEEIDLLTLAGRCRRRLAEQVQDLHHWSDRPEHRRKWAALSRELARQIQSEVAEVVDAEIMQQWLVAADASMPEYVLLRGLLDALDEFAEHSPDLWARCLTEGERALLAGEAIPRRPPPVCRTFGAHGLSTRPESQGRGLLTCEWIAFVPETEELRFRLRPHEQDLFARVGRDAIVSFVLPVADVGVGYTIPSSVEGLFGPVEPTEPTQHRATVRKLLELVADSDVVILPELAGDADLWQEPSAILLVGGSAHVTGHDGRTRNVAVMRCGGTEARHHKFAPMEVDGRREDIITSPAEVVVHLTPSWAGSLLICKDFLRRQLVTWLAELGVNLLFVPAATPKTDAFENHAAEFISLTQGLVVMANSCGEADECAASVLVHAPLSAGPFIVRRRELSPPGVVSVQIGPTLRRLR